MRTKLVVHPSAQDEYNALDPEVRPKVLRGVKQLRDDPTGHPHVNTLTGFPHHYRLRVGDHRVIFRMEPGVAHILAVGNRRDIYRTWGGKG